jgi:hypothetical protein
VVPVVDLEILSELDLDLEDLPLPRPPLMPNFRREKDTEPCPPPSHWDENLEDE